MAKETVSRTALGAAICRLIEQHQPEESRLFQDPVAKELVGGSIRLAMRFASVRDLTVRQTDAVAKGIYGVQVCRTRFIDEVVQRGLSRGIKQLVILGAGLDTRPYRLPGMEAVRTFEVDLPAAQVEKKKRIRKYLGRLPGNVVFIPMDFDTQELEAVFSQSDFNPSSPAIFVWEAVTQYISEKAVRQTLAFVGKLSPGTVLVFTYVLKSIVERRSSIPDADRLMDVVSNQSPWVFGMEPAGIAEFLGQYHLFVVADVGNPDYQERYLRPIGRILTVFDGERIVEATVH